MPEAGLVPARGAHRVVTRPSLLSELKRRNVLRAAALYVGTVWLLAQVVTQLGPVFDTPAWVARWFLAGSAVGFPFWIALAWLYELTPDGLKRESDVAPGDSIRQLTGRRLDRAIIAVLAVAVVLLLTNTFVRHREGVASNQDAAPTVSAKSIAVLPLVNASNDPNQQFFSDGLSENLIDSLSRFDGLKVIGRTSAFQFRDSKDDSTTIGRKLGVAYLLNGSVQRAVNVVRISTSLIRASDGSTLWAEHYDRPYKNLFALQDEIAQAVAGALHARLLSPEAAAKQDDRPPSGNIEAYNAYLHGLKFEREWSTGKSTEYFAKAVQLDPGYAVAWAHLSGAWTGIARYGDVSPATARENMRKARSAVDKALQLAPELGIAHVDKAWVSVVDSDYRSALTECRRGLQLAPESGPILYGCSYVMAMYGKLGEAIETRGRLISVEPLVADHYPEYANLLIAAGRLDEAQKQIGTAQELEGKTQPRPDYMLTFAVLRGDAKAALDAARQTEPGARRDHALAFATQIDPDRAVADAALAKFLHDHPDWGDSQPYDLALLYALHGDPDNTVEWLDRTLSRNDVFQIQQVLYNPLMMRFRDDPKFIAFCKKAGLPPPSESEALSIDQIRAL